MWDEELSRNMPSGDSSQHLDGRDPHPVVNDVPTHNHDDAFFDIPSCHPRSPDILTDSPEHQPKRARVNVEAEKMGPGRYALSYPAEAATVLGIGESRFQQMQNNCAAQGQSPWSPFMDQDEQGLAEWMMKRINNTGMEEFLDLPIVCVCISISLFMSPISL